VGTIVPVQVLVLLVAVVAWRAAVIFSSTGWPEHKRQIPRWWVQPITPYGLILAGIVIGSGVFTQFRYAVFYVMLMSVAAVGANNGYISVGVGALYGAVTGAMVLARGGKPDEFTGCRYSRLEARGIALARVLAVVMGLAGISLFGMTVLLK
jgi:hypothetical protein